MDQGFSSVAEDITDIKSKMVTKDDLAAGAANALGC
jgi:hypothetical protein